MFRSQLNSIHKIASAAACGAIVVALAIIMFTGCGSKPPEADSDGGSSGPDPAKLMPEIAKLQKIASAPGEKVSRSVGPEAATIDLPENVKVIVPKGALSKNTRMHAAVVNLKLDRIASDVKKARVFAVETDDDFPQLGSPVMIEVKVPTKNTAVARLENGQWKLLAIEQGDTVRIPITHFSRSVFGLVEFLSSTEQAIASGLNTTKDIKDPINFENRRAETGGPNAREFFGVDDIAGGPDCTEFNTVLSQFTAPGAFKFPASAESEGSTGTLGRFLHAAKTPAQQGGYYHDLVKDSHAKIHARLLGHNGKASPALFLKFCIDENGGNVPLGVLAAHNYLKDITYRGRDTWDAKRTMPQDSGEAAAHLKSWRINGNKASAGYYDKMGPLYHIFAAMTATVWGGKGLGVAAVEGESFLRAFRVGADKADIPKADADACGRSIGFIILDTEQRSALPKDSIDKNQPAQERLVYKLVRIDYKSAKKTGTSLGGTPRDDFPFPDQVLTNAAGTLDISYAEKDAKANWNLTAKVHYEFPAEIVFNKTYDGAVPVGYVHAKASASATWTNSGLGFPRPTRIRLDLAGASNGFKEKMVGNETYSEKAEVTLPLGLKTGSMSFYQKTVSGPMALIVEFHGPENRYVYLTPVYELVQLPPA